jgi:hypothetical protein
MSCSTLLGMKIDSTIILVLIGVKINMAFPFGLRYFLVQGVFYHASGGGLKWYQPA